MKGKRHPEKVGRKNNRCLRIVEIRYTPTPDADWRLRCAVDILLRSAVREPEGSINAKKEEDPPQDNPLTEAIEKIDESQSSGETARTAKGDT